jgi:NAD(P)-dependent dehydrogenase (short-subunit alcohol dehydrogenase family)
MMTQRSALITGGSTGIGLAIAEMLVEDGWAVSICARNPEKLNSAATRLRSLSSGTSVLTIAANLADSSAPERIAQQHLAEFGGLDLLVNNAGIGLVGPIASKTPKALDLEININFRNAYRLIQECLPALTTSAQLNDTSYLINVSSITARENPPNASIYAATKAALVALSHSAHAELSRSGIHVTALMPGFVDTPGTSWAADSTRELMLVPSDVAEAVRFILHVSSRCFIPEIILTSSGSGVFRSPVDWDTVSEGL